MQSSSSCRQSLDKLLLWPCSRGKGIAAAKSIRLPFCFCFIAYTWPELACPEFLGLLGHQTELFLICFCRQPPKALDWYFTELILIWSQSKYWPEATNKSLSQVYCKKYFSELSMASKSIEATDTWTDFREIIFAVLHSAPEESLLHCQGSSMGPAPSWKLRTFRLVSQKPRCRDSLQGDFGGVKVMIHLLQWTRARYPPRPLGTMQPCMAPPAGARSHHPLDTSLYHPRKASSFSVQCPKAAVRLKSHVPSSYAMFPAVAYTTTSFRLAACIYITGSARYHWSQPRYLIQTMRVLLICVNFLWCLNNIKPAKQNEALIWITQENTVSCFRLSDTVVIRCF